MAHLVYERDSGRIVAQVPADLLPTVLPHHATIEVETVPDFNLFRVVDGALAALEWPIATLRRRAWEAIKVARDAAQDGGCATPLGRVDSDDRSLSKIGGSVQLAMLAQADGKAFSIAWTMQDNSTAVHDAPAMIAMGIAVGQHIAACHAEGLRRRAAIMAADSATAVAAVPVEGGWPGEIS